MCKCGHAAHQDFQPPTLATVYKICCRQMRCYGRGLHENDAPKGRRDRAVSLRTCLPLRTPRPSSRLSHLRPLGSMSSPVVWSTSFMEQPIFGPRPLKSSGVTSTTLTHTLSPGATTPPSSAFFSSSVSSRLNDR
eukprot:366441-Chlamydomonas_euryale.AAC.11